MRIIVLGEVERRKGFLNFQGKGIVFFFPMESMRKVEHFWYAQVFF